MVLDDLAKAPTRSTLNKCIVDLDARVEAVQTGDNIRAIHPNVYEAFTSGNMHRIKFRKIRDAAIRKYLS